MPGAYLNLDLPSLSDTMTTIVTKLVAALNAVQTDLTPKIASGIINVNASLPCNGNPLTSVGNVQFGSGNVPTAAGSLYYNGGEFYAIDQAGTIQLTLNGQLNASSVGGISGMGGTNAAVTYVNASTQFQFTSSSGVYAQVAASNAILHNTGTGTVTLGVDSSVTTPLTVNVKSLPSAGVSMLVYNAATSTLEDGAVTALTNKLAGGLTTQADLKHTDLYSMGLPLGPLTNTVNAAPLAGSVPLQFSSTGTNWQAVLPVMPLRTGDRINTYTFSTGQGGGNVTSTLQKYSLAGGVSTVDTATFANASGNSYSRTVPGASQAAIAAGEVWFLLISGTASGITIVEAHVSWDHP